MRHAAYTTGDSHITRAVAEPACQCARTLTGMWLLHLVLCRSRGTRFMADGVKLHGPLQSLCVGSVWLLQYQHAGDTVGSCTCSCVGQGCWGKPQGLHSSTCCQRCPVLDLRQVTKQAA